MKFIKCIWKIGKCLFQGYFYKLVNLVKIYLFYHYLLLKSHFCVPKSLGFICQLDGYGPYSMYE